MPNRTVIHLDDSDDKAKPADIFGDNGDGDNDDGLGPNEGAIDGITPNNGLGMREMV